MASESDMRCLPQRAETPWGGELMMPAAPGAAKAIFDAPVGLTHRSSSPGPYKTPVLLGAEGVAGYALFRDERFHEIAEALANCRILDREISPDQFDHLLLA